jgi:glycosyltransferase involved in cell wall biosynthesis
VLIPDGQITWVPAALVQALLSLRRQPAQLIYSTYPPASDHLLALLLQRMTRLPWVADFRDSWTADPLDPELEADTWRRRREERLEQRVVRCADAVIAATGISAEHLRRHCRPGEDKVRVIPNGFDPDLAGPSGAPPVAPPLRLVHTGSFAASHPRRSPGPLFAALQRLLDLDRAWAWRLRLILVGALRADEAAAVAPLVAAGMVEAVGPQPRSVAAQLQRSAHVLLLVDHPRPWLASNVPGKLYEYLAAGRPVLALCGPGETQRLLERLGGGRCVASEDVQAIAQTLVEWYEAMLAGCLPAPVPPEALQPFWRPQQAAALAACFDQVRAAARRP